MQRRCCVAAMVLPVLISVALSHAQSPQASRQVGRPVRIVSFSFRPGKPLDQILKLVDREGTKGVDLIVLPETWRGQNDQSVEAIDGPTSKALMRLAKKHQTYIVSPIDAICDDKKRCNTAVVIDREGKIAGTYNKVFPYWSEYRHKVPVQPGRDASVIETDFGKLGMAICFDVNFPEVWQELADGGAELVVWPSAYSAGRHLQAYALLHHYYIVTATYQGDCQVYDITGERILDERSDGIHVSRIILDLDRGIYHRNFNGEKLTKLLAAHGDEISKVEDLDREAWYVLQATRPGVSARALAKQYGMEELRDYIHRSRREIDKMRATNSQRAPLSGK
ncbi:MAG: carbon-nitrogen hydrolase family protein [Pirellulaceae bacterium]|nr:carbon-nitrogen hydrolase family protein [Pirellulaceae bacterium]MDP7304278.1 carbon-nitrogen hydrolase family protein [Pirellulaceae bacterium]HJN09477.1 carbon-nitrogen hydrolase family protein [Pirellulaceae bacterium]